MAALSPETVAHLAHDAGIPWVVTPIAVAIAWAESGLDPNAVNNNPSTGDLSYGLWQINLYGSNYSRCTNLGWCPQTLTDPKVNAKAMASLSNKGTKWTDWTTYTRGTYTGYLNQAAQATNKAFGGTVVPDGTHGTPSYPAATEQAAANVAAAGSGQQAGGGGGACTHTVTLGPLGTIELCKPMAMVEIAGGVLIMLVGVVILGLAMANGAFPGAAKVAAETVPITRALKTARRARGSSPAAAPVAASRAPRAARYKPPPSPGEVAEVRNRQALGRAKLRQARAGARISEARARQTRGGGDVVYLGGRPVRKSTLSPKMRAAVEKAS